MAQSQLEPGSKPGAQKYPKAVPLEKVLKDFANVRQRVTPTDRAREEERTAELAASIRRDGLLQRPLVRPHPERGGPDGYYQLIFGNRRVAAATSLGHGTIDVEVREGLTDEEARTLQMQENLEREALSPIEEAVGIHQMVTLDGKKKRDIARDLGMDASEVTRRLNLLKLSRGVREHVHHGDLSPAHGEVLYKHLGDDEEAQVRFAERAVEEGLPKRVLEQYIREYLSEEEDGEAGDLTEERFYYLGPTATTELRFKKGLLPEEGGEREADKEQRELFFRFGAIAALMAFNNKPLRRELGLGLPAYPADVDDYYRHVFGLSSEEAEALLFRAIRLFFEGDGNRTNIFGETLIAPYMDEVLSGIPEGAHKERETTR